MLNVKIYAGTFNKDYFRCIYYLKDKGRIKDIVYYGNKPLRFLISKLINGFGKPTFFEIFRSFFAPIILLFTKDAIVVGVEPYSFRVIIPLLLKKLDKKIIYLTSWPYWDYSKNVVKPNFITKKLWNSFLKNLNVVTTTETARQNISKKGAKSVHIPHVVDLDIFNLSKKKNDNVKVLYVGRIVKEKGVEGILNAAKKFTDVEFWFVGRGGLVCLLEGLPNIKYFGFIEDKKRLAEIYSKCNIFVLNSYATDNWEELFGISLVEAMASGLAVIATDCVGPREIVKNNVNGYLIKQKDEKALFTCLENLIKDKGLREKFGSNAVKIAKKGYSVSIRSEDWLNLFKA
ncbi:glycosyltransferase family 4 protein [Candidatus Woesearchaeota archaeon]|nr:glycosyltransferase family 4 protein [Candidatus Woesearchaeota archaeon]